MVGVIDLLLFLFKPGVPGVITGRNERVAWGVTNVGNDVQDLYVLTESSDKAGYWADGIYYQYKLRPETILVKDQDAVSRVRELSLSLIDFHGAF